MSIQQRVKQCLEEYTVLFSDLITTIRTASAEQKSNISKHEEHSEGGLLTSLNENEEDDLYFDQEKNLGQAIDSIDTINIGTQPFKLYAQQKTIRTVPVTQAMERLLEKDRELYDLIDELKQHQQFQNKIESVKQEINEKDNSLSQLLTSLNKAHGILLRSLHSSKDTIDAMKRSKPVNLETTIQYANRIGGSTAPPPNWQPGQFLRKHLPAYPHIEDMGVRRSMLYKKIDLTKYGKEGVEEPKDIHEEPKQEPLTKTEDQAQKPLEKEEEESMVRKQEELDETQQKSGATTDLFHASPKAVTESSQSKRKEEKEEEESEKEKSKKKTISLGFGGEDEDEESSSSSDSSSDAEFTFV